MRTHLAGHTDMTSAYEVADYPYGFSARCKIRYWLEKNEKHGYRFVSQTQNPKTGAWNKPKAGTYIRVAAALYLDEEGHVQCAGISEYTSAPFVLSFVKDFPGACVTDVTAWAIMKVKYLQRTIAGEISITINGQRSEYTEAEKAEDVAELAIWEQVRDLARAEYLTEKGYITPTAEETTGGDK